MYTQMGKTVALLVVLLVATATVCRSADEPAVDTEKAKDHAEDASKEAAKDGSSWTEWAMGKVTGAFKSDEVKETAHNVANQASNAASGSSEYLSEKAGQAEDAAAEAAKKISNSHR